MLSSARAEDTGSAPHWTPRRSIEPRVVQREDAFWIEVVEFWLLLQAGFPKALLELGAR